MKRICLIIALGLLSAMSVSAQIVNNTGSSSEDSLSVLVLSLDSLGNPTSADSFFVLVLKSDVNAPVFRDSGTVGMIGLDTTYIAGQRYYYYHRAVADIDGAGGAGSYGGVVTAKRNTGNLLTPNPFQFQIVNQELSDVLDSVYAVLDSLQHGLAGVTANLAAVSGDLVAADNFETMLDGTGGKKLTLSALHLKGAVTDTPLIINSHGPLPAALIRNDSVGSGLWIMGGMYGGDAITLTTSPVDPGGHGVNIDIYGDHKDGIHISSNEGAGIYAIGGDTLPGIRIHGGPLVANGLEVSAGQNGGDAARFRSTNGDGIELIGGGSGKDLNADLEIQGGSSGSGAYAHTVVAIDSSSLQTIAGVDIAVRNLSQSALMAFGRSNGDGRASFNLDAASYLAVADAPGYQFRAFDTINVSGAGADTVYAFPISPGPPSSASLCRVYGYLYTIAGQPAVNASVSAALPGGVVRAGNLVVSPYSVSTVTDTAGYFYLDLLPSDSLIPSGSKYEIVISRSDGAVLRQRLKIPTASSWRLTW